MKFKLGDRVRVKANNKCGGGQYAGQVGIIGSVHTSFNVYPYEVEFEVEFDDVDIGAERFHAIELERVKEEGDDRLLFEERGRLVRGGLSREAHFFLQKGDGKTKDIDLTAEMVKFEGEQVKISIERVR